MGQVLHCHIPITVTVSGTPDDVQLRELGDRVRRQVLRRLAEADAAVAEHRALRAHPPSGAATPGAVTADSSTIGGKPQNRAAVSAPRRSRPVDPDDAAIPGRGWKVLRQMTISLTLGEFLDFWRDGVGHDLADRVLYTDFEAEQRRVTVWLVQTEANTTVRALGGVVGLRAKALLRLPSSAALLYAASSFDGPRQTLAMLDPSGAVARLPALSRRNARRAHRAGDDVVLLHGGWMLWAGMRLPTIDPTSWLDLGPFTQRRLPLTDVADCVDTAAFERAHLLSWSDYVAEAGTSGVRVDLMALRVRRDLPANAVRFLAIREYGQRAGPPPGNDIQLVADLYDALAAGVPDVVTSFGSDFAGSLPALPAPSRTARAAPGPRAASGTVAVLAAVYLPVDAEILGAARYRPQAGPLAVELRRLMAQINADRYRMYRLYDWLGGTFDRPVDTRPPGGTLFEYVLGEFSAAEVDRLFDTVEGTGWEGLERRLALLCVPTRFAGNGRAAALLGRLQAETWSGLKHTFRETTAADAGGIDLDRDAGLAVRVGVTGRDTLGDVEGLYITSSERKFLKPEPAGRLREALAQARVDVVADVAAGRTSGELSVEDFAREALARAARVVHITDDDYVNRTVERSIRLVHVARRDLHQMPSWDVTFRFVERVKGSSEWTDVSDRIIETSDDFSARLTYWALGRAGEFYRTVGLTITIIGGVAIAWEAGLVAALVELAGGTTAVVTSIAISEIIYLIRVVFFDEKPSLEGFLMAAVDGYLGALGFRGAAFVGAPIGRTIGTTTLTRLWTGVVVEKLAIGTVGGGASAAMSLFAQDAVDTMIHDGHFHSAADYARVVTVSAAFGVLAEFTISPVLHRLGGSGVAPRGQVADLIGQLRREGYGLADFVASSSAALSRLGKGLMGIMVDDAAAAYLRAFRARISEIVTAWRPSVVARRVLEMSGATMTREAEAGLRIFLEAAEQPGSQEAARRLAEQFAGHPQAAVHLLEVLSTLDRAAARDLMTGTFSRPAELAAFLGRLARYPADQQRGVLRLLAELTQQDLTTAPGWTGLVARPAGVGAGAADVREAQAAVALAAEARHARIEAASLRAEAEGQLDEGVVRSADDPGRAERLLDAAAAHEREAVAKEELAAELSAGHDPRAPGKAIPDWHSGSGAELAADIDRVFAQLEAGGGTARQPWIRLPAHRGLTAPETDALTRTVFSSRSGNPVVFRVEGGTGTERSRSFITVGETGSVAVETGGRDLNLNVGSFERAVEFMIEHRPGSTLKAFEVEAGWLRSLRGIATPEQGVPARVTAADPGGGTAQQLPSGGSLRDVRGTARTVDTRQAADQLQIDASLVHELQEFVVPGTGRGLIFTSSSPSGRPR